MIEPRIDLENCTCAKCNKKFENGSTMFRAIRKFDENYCYDCKRYEYMNSVHHKRSPEYALYYIENDFGKLVINEEMIDEVPVGIHEVGFKNEENRRFFYYECMMDELDDARIFLKGAAPESFILEKKEKFMCLFFPNSRVLDIYDFYDNRNQYDDIINRFPKLSKHDEFYYICFSNEIYGIASKKIYKYDSRILNAREMESFSLETMESLEKFYISNAISRYMECSLKKMTPAVMLDYCENRIQGQGIELKKAVYKIYRYVKAVASGEPFQAENWLLTSPSGTGKTEFFRTIKDLFKEYKIPIPVVQIDLSQITETGFKGANVSTIPQRILSEKSATGGIGICFLDEADKKCIPAFGSHGIDYNAAAQANLLTLLEGIETDVETDGKKQKFDSNKTMFVLIGSFQQLRDRKQEEEANVRRIGFWSEEGAKDKSDVFYEDLTIQDIIDFGMQEELAGRITSVINFHKLSKKDMTKLLKKKTELIGQELGCNIYIKKSAEKELVELAFGNLGARQPMNIIRTLTQNAIAGVFFDRGFDEKTDKVVIDSTEKAHIETSKKRDIPNAETLRAFEEVEELKKDPNKKTYNSFEEMMEDINSEM